MRPNLPAVADHEVGAQRHLDLSPAELPPEQQPAIVYLSSLSVNSRRLQATALAAIAAILIGDACSALQLPWHRLRFIPTHAAP